MTSFVLSLMVLLILNRCSTSCGENRCHKNRRARFFWLCTRQLRNGDLVESVTFETDDVSVVDDVRVSRKYSNQRR